MSEANPLCERRLTMPARRRFQALSTALALLSVLGASSHAQQIDSPAQPAAAEGSGDAASTLGRITKFALPDAQGTGHTERDWLGAKAVVILFLATDCPISNAYAPAMTRLENEFGPQGVRFFGVHCDTDVTAAIAARHAADYRLAFPILLDPEQLLARPAGVAVTPEAVVLLPDGEIVYRGRIDDRYATPGKRREQPSTHDLASAIAAVLAGERPSPAQTKATGCPLPPLESATGK